MQGREEDRGSLGRLGERLARTFLESRGYRIVAVDFRIGRHQADLLAWEGGRPVVVEVKSCRGPGRPAAHFTLRQASRLLALGESFFQGRGGPVRIDLVIVQFPRKGSPRIEVFPDRRLLP